MSLFSSRSVVVIDFITFSLTHNLLLDRIYVDLTTLYEIYF